MEALTLTIWWANAILYIGVGLIWALNGRINWRTAVMLIAGRWLLLPLAISQTADAVVHAQRGSLAWWLAAVLGYVVAWAIGKLFSYFSGGQL